MRALAYGLFALGLALAVIAGFTFYAAFTDFLARGCPGAAQCSDAVSVMVIMACSLVAAGVLIFAGIVFVRR